MHFCYARPFTTFVHRRCDLCGGPRMSHYCWWNRRIANPIKFCGYEGRGRTAMLILKHQILPKLLLRRTKMDCADDLALPPRRLEVGWICLVPCQLGAIIFQKRLLCSSSSGKCLQAKHSVCVCICCVAVHW